MDAAAGTRVGTTARAPPPLVRWIDSRMFCAISGTTPTTAVVTPRGIVYERSLIVKAIEVRRRRRDDDGKEEDCARMNERMNEAMGV